MVDISNPSKWPSLAEPNAEYAEFVKSIGQAPDLGMVPDIASLRSFIEDAKKNVTASVAETVTGIKEEDRQITMRDGSKITVRIYSPEKPPSSGSPLGVMYHGGGWCIGGLDNEVPLCRQMAGKFGMTVVDVDYRLGPEHKFPVGHHDCYDATKWAAENASSLGADPSKGFLVGGTSAGGNLAAFVVHEWRDNNMSPKITGAHLMIPAVCDYNTAPEELKKDWHSVRDLEHADILSHKAMNLFMENYIPNVKDRTDPKFSPMLHPNGHKNLPPAYFQICGSDPLRDEALIYERMLREAGVTTKVEMYPGVPHGFFSIFPQLQISQKFAEESVAGMKWLLEQR